MTDSIPVTFGLQIALIIALTSSSIILSVQKSYGQDESSQLKKDFVRDIHTPFSNGYRMFWILLETFILMLHTCFVLFIHVTEHSDNVEIVIGSAMTLITYVYCLLLAITAFRFPLPSTTGWSLNVHLCVLYGFLFISSTTTCFHVLWKTSISWTLASIYFLPAMITLHLFYTTATVKNGSPFLDENGKIVIGYNVESIYGIFYFNWITPLMTKIKEKGSTLSDNDLPILPLDQRAQNIYHISGNSRGQNLLKRLFLTSQKSILIQAVLSTISPILFFSTPFFLNRLLIVIQKITLGEGDSHSLSEGLVYIFGMALFIIISNLLMGQLWFFAQSDTQTRIKSMLNMEIYLKTLRRRDTLILSSKTKDEPASSMTGMIVNLMSTDSSRVSDFASFWNILIECPLQLFIGTYFLFTLLGWSAILGLAVMIIAVPVNHFNSKLSIGTQAKLMKTRDKRVSLMNEVLQGIRQIKFFAWESNWTKRILKTRNIELDQLRTIYFTEVIFGLLWQGTPLLVTTVAFWSFTKLEGKELTAPIAFTAMTIFHELRSSFTLIPETIVHLFETLISIDRIQNYLSEQDPPSHLSFDLRIGFQNATMTWPKLSDSIRHDIFTLKDINVIFPNDQLSLICGPTGSGKTLLMLSLLGETEICQGSVYCPTRQTCFNLDQSTSITFFNLDENQGIVPENWILSYAMAYVSQTPWLQNATIKENILFGLPYVQERYKATLTACALDKDLSYLEDGDATEIGEKGITLSGGQKARVALARAVYSRAQNVMMDDVLSAVDAHTAKHVYKNCLQGPLMRGRTQILITHHVNLCIQGAAHVVFVKEGRLAFSGSPTELKIKDPNCMIFEGNLQEDEDISSSETISNIEEVKTKPKTLVQEEERATGTVKRRLYRLYFKLVGNWFFWSCILLTSIGVRWLDILRNWWLKKWAQSYEISSTTPFSKEDATQSLNTYLGIYIIINLASLVLSIARYAYMFYGGLRASKTIYEQLLDRVFHAPLRFFDTTPVGRIINRFSKDIETIDSHIPIDIMQFSVKVIIVLSIVIVATSVLPFLISLMVITALFNIYYGFKFVAASRELKRMDSISRSPLFTLFSETILGVTTIRAFGMSQHFLLDMLDRIDVNARPMFYAWSISRWVIIRISMLGSIVCLVTGIAIMFHLDRVDAATAGFCLSYVLVFTNMSYWTVRRYTQVEMSFNAVERVVEFLEMDQEAPSITNIRPPSEWPSQGSIQVNDLHVKYATDLETVLKGLTFTVKAKEKIGIVGRTGSGKSTLALAFFRFIEAFQGSIMIDGINIADIGTEDLRSNLTIIPQDPVLFSGSLKSNMDPFNEFTEQEIFTALRRVHLLDVHPVFNNLSTTVNEGGQNFSQGQRQLLCLARALLKNQKIILMDEATASVDFETDKAIQKTIAHEFSNSTILCIAHRLNTVIEYDRILVMDHGQMIEFESPLTLIQDTNSAFYKMCRHSGEFEHLLEHAKAKHELVDTT